jgi:hypothetical protein
MNRSEKIKLARKDLLDGFPERDVLKKYDLKIKDLTKKEKKIPGFKIERKKSNPGPGAQLAPPDPGAQLAPPDPGAQLAPPPDKEKQAETLIDPKLSSLFSESPETPGKDEEDILSQIDESGLELLLQDREMIYELLDFYVADILKSDKPATKSQKKILGILIPRIAEKRLKGKSFQYLDEIILLLVLSSITLPRIDWKKINSMKGK